MADAGTFKLGVLEDERFSLDEINEAPDAIGNRSGRLTNVVIMH